MIDLRTSLLALGCSAFGASAGFAQQQGVPYYRHHMWDGGPWMFFGPLMMIFFIAITVLFIVLLLRWLGVVGETSGQKSSSSLRHTPLDILKERFARGEIDKEEYEERRRVLGE